MLKFVCFCVLIAITNGHKTKQLIDGDMQSALMPQELNPEFVPDKDGPWRSIIPMPRQRRDIDAPPDMEVETSGISSQLKKVSRVVACVVLAISAAIEIILYIVESYSVG